MGSTPNHSEQFIKALDELVDAGFDPAQVSETRRRHADAIADLLSHLDTPMPEGAATLDSENAADARLLVDVTMARLRRSGSLAGTLAGETGIDAADAARIDDLVENGWESSDDAIGRLLATLDDRTPTDPVAKDRLVSATLDRLQSQIDDSHNRMRIDTPVAAPSRFQRRLKDLGAVAAMVVIGSMAMWPIVGGNQDNGPVIESNWLKGLQVQQPDQAPTATPTPIIIEGIPNMPSPELHFGPQTSSR